MGIEFSVVGREQLAAKLRSRAAAIKQEVRAAMFREMQSLAGYVQAAKLSGNVLRTRTGTLRRSIHGETTAEGGAVVGTVGTRVHYARPHELGGVFLRPAHQRMMTTAWGRPVLNPRMIDVRAHDANYPQRALAIQSL